MLMATAAGLRERLVHVVWRPLALFFGKLV